MATLSEKFQYFCIPSLQERKLKEKRGKIAIVEEAIKLLINSKYLLLDTGSTTEYVSEKIKILDKYKEFSIITNELNVAYVCFKLKYGDFF